MAYPTYNPEWAVENTYSDGTTPNKQRPDLSLRQYGYTPTAEPTAQELNWQFNNIYQQLVELKDTIVNAGQKQVGELFIIDGDDRNPSVILGYGTWQAFGQGRVLVGVGTGTDANGVQRSFSAGSTGGEYVHTITVPEMPSHTHQLTLQYQGNNKASEGNAYASNGEVAQGDFVGTDTRVTQSTGGSQPMDITQPFITVHIWKRIS